MYLFFLENNSNVTYCTVAIAESEKRAKDVLDICTVLKLSEDVRDISGLLSIGL
jgi:hypothetical protein